MDKDKYEILRRNLSDHTRSLMQAELLAARRNTESRRVESIIDELLIDFSPNASVPPEQVAKQLAKFTASLKKESE